MFNILITSPILLSFQVVEIQDYLPSFKMAINTNIDLITGKYDLQNLVWFTCKEWDAFSSQLYQIEQSDNVTAKLESLSGNFKITIQEIDHKFKILLHFKDDGQEDMQLAINFSQEIDRDSLSSIVSKVRGANKWW